MKIPPFLYVITVIAFTEAQQLFESSVAHVGPRSLRFPSSRLSRRSGGGASSSSSRMTSNKAELSSKTQNAPKGLAGSSLPPRKPPRRAPPTPGPSDSSGRVVAPPSHRRARTRVLAQRPLHPEPGEPVTLDVHMTGPGRLRANTFGPRPESQHIGPNVPIETIKHEIKPDDKVQEFSTQITAPERIQAEVKSKPGGTHHASVVGAFGNIKTKTSKSDQSSAVLQSYSGVGGRKIDKAEDGDTAYLKAMSQRQHGMGVSADVDGKAKSTINVDNRPRIVEDEPGPRPPNWPFTRG